MDEILLQLNRLNVADFHLNFVPWRGDFARGIFTTSMVKTDMCGAANFNIFKDFYKDHKFVTVSQKPIDMKQVINTNRCAIQIEQNGNTVAVHSAIDNLLKGASGQAIQNMNLAMGWPEHAGLQLKPIVF